MKKLRTRILSLLLLLLVVVNTLPVAVLADAITDDSMTVSASSAWGAPGDSVQITVNLERNPGIASLVLDIAYDEYLTLTNVSFNSAFGMYVTAAEPYSNPQRLSFMNPTSDTTTTGVFATLTFKIAESAPDNHTANISIAYDPNNTFNQSFESVDVVTIDGAISVYHKLPGDVNADGTVDNKDVILLFRYVAGWSVDVDTAALDTDGDNKITNKDTITLFRYVAGWPDIEIKRGEVCTHDLIHSAAKDATCTEDGQIEFWYCELCGRLYKDAVGDTQISRQDAVIPSREHTVVIDHAVPATYTTPGLTEGSHCSVCNKILVEQQETPVVPSTGFNITYNLSGSDTYLASVGVANNNPNAYISEIGLQLEDPSAPGYVFKGWKVTGSEALIGEIPAGTTGHKTLYAQWEKVVYTINFDSPDVPVDSITYTIDTGATLISPKLEGYTFVGWSIDGEIVSTIPKGSMGNITVHANWTSNRNRGQSVSSLANPNIIEDMENGRYYFIYEIGTIETIPLSVLEPYGYSQGLTITESKTYTTTIDEGLATKVTNTISNATTTTSSWTLSEEWNQATAATNEKDEQIGKTEGKVDSEGNVTGEKYYISNVSGGSTSVSTNSGGSSSSSSKVTTGNSTGLSGKYYNESEVNTSVDLNVEGGLSAGYGPVKAEISAGIGTNVSTHDKTTQELVGSRNTNVGTYKENNSNSYWDTNKSTTSNWNTTDGYDISAEASKSTELTKAISEIISSRYGYTSTESRTENNSSTITKGGEEKLTDEYEATVEYSLESKTESSKNVVKTYSEYGYYRLILAGTAHVFAVVGYDVATGSYFTTTYTVLDSNTYVHMDYSAVDPTFNDCENAVIPFEVPYFVHEYISGITARSEGLVVDINTGYITEYQDPFADLGNTIEHEQNIVIPEYVSVDHLNGTYSAVKVRGIAANAFKGNTNITGIYLPKYITEIPDNAFEGCTNLETVIAYGVTKIGNNAFKGCTSLTTFAIDSAVTFIGTNAFEDCPEIRAMAASADVANAVLNSGAKKITLDLTMLSDSFDNRKITVSDSTEYFALFGGGKTFTNLQVESNATETFLSQITFIGNADTPLTLNSDIIQLGSVSVVKAPGFALVIKSTNAEVKLLGNIMLSSQGDHAVISRNVTFSKANSDYSGTMQVGVIPPDETIQNKYLICGTITNESMLTASNGIEYIDEDTFNSMLTSSTVAFNANDGSVSESSKTVYYGQYYGVLPVPTRANYTFAGWYTDAEGGTQITADSIVTALVNQTLYAHWTPNTFTMYFDANGGSVSPTYKALTFGNNLGSLPTPTRANYTFAGWYDANGNPVYDSTVPGSATDFTVYAHWTPMTFTLYYDANGGWTSTSAKTLTFGDSLGSLPTPTRANYIFTGWYDANGNPVNENTVPSSATDLTIYAHWVMKDPIGWVKASDVPEGAQIVDRKYTYTQTYYTTSGSSYLDGWTHYNTTSAWSDYGAWSAWQDGAIDASDSRQVETQEVVASTNYKTVYHYYYYSKSETNGYTSYQPTTTYGKNLYKVSFDSALPKDGSVGGYTKYKWSNHHGTGYYMYVYADDPYTTQEVVSYNYKTQYRYRDRSLIYTYYFYRTENLEMSSYPSGNDISNVQEWVCYIPK